MSNQRTGVGWDPPNKEDAFSQMRILPSAKLAPIVIDKPIPIELIQYEEQHGKLPTDRGVRYITSESMEQHPNLLTLFKLTQGHWLLVPNTDIWYFHTYPVSANNVPR